MLKSHTYFVIVSSDAIVRAVDGILDTICVVQDLPCSINIRFAPFEITKQQFCVGKRGKNQHVRIRGLVLGYAGEQVRQEFKVLGGVCRPGSNQLAREE